MECEGIISIDSNISKSSGNKKSRYPFSGTFELTIRCNLHCKMCLFRHDDCENTILKRNELSSSQWIDLAKQVADAGTFQLLITGGEPMLRPDFCEIWEGIYKQGFILELYTNATLVNHQIMDTLRRYPPHKIGVTIYGASRDTYEQVTGSSEAFDKMVNGLKQLLTLPSIISYRTTLIKDNCNDFIEINNMVDNITGTHTSVTFAKDVICPVRGGTSDVRNCRLDQNTMSDLILKKMEWELTKKLNSIGITFDKIETNINMKAKPKSAEQEFFMFGCHAGISSYTISNDGKLLGCQLSDVFSIDLKTESFSDAWNRYPSVVKIPERIQCNNCEHYLTCEACPVMLYAETGSFTKCSPYFMEKNLRFIKEE